MEKILHLQDTARNINNMSIGSEILTGTIHRLLVNGIKKGWEFIGPSSDHNNSAPFIISGSKFYENEQLVNQVKLDTSSPKRILLLTTAKSLKPLPANGCLSELINTVNLGIRAETTEEIILGYNQHSGVPQKRHIELAFDAHKKVKSFSLTKKAAERLRTGSNRFLLIIERKGSLKRSFIVYYSRKITRRTNTVACYRASISRSVFKKFVRKELPDLLDELF